MRSTLYSPWPRPSSSGGSPSSTSSGSSRHHKSGSKTKRILWAGRDGAGRGGTGRDGAGRGGAGACVGWGHRVSAVGVRFCIPY